MASITATTFSTLLRQPSRRHSSHQAAQSTTSPRAPLDLAPPPASLPSPQLNRPHVPEPIPIRTPERTPERPSKGKEEKEEDYLVTSPECMTPTSDTGEVGNMDLDSGNARSKTTTVAEGVDTYGTLNRHPAPGPDDVSPAADASPAPSTSNTHPSHPTSFRVGVSEDKNKKCRRTMEDAHAFVYDFAGVRGQGYFAVFDGHAGKHAAEWCGQHFHEHLLDAIRDSPDKPVPDLLNNTFMVVDGKLSELAKKEGTHSGCTAVTVFLRLEDEKGRPVRRKVPVVLGTGKGVDGADTGISGDGAGEQEAGHRQAAEEVEKRKEVEVVEAADEKIRRTLYTANVGDARAVLCRNGKAVRLTYDHKGSDHQEAKRITDAGGFVMNNRVNGVLAVTRSLGDSSMKEFVVGSPYTTETTLSDEDEFIIVACDGLWDVIEDQQAVELIRDVKDPQEASRILLDQAMSLYTTDNVSCLVVRF